jgi:hypothetical protein
VRRLALLVALAALAGCGGKDKKAAATPTPSPAATETTPAPAPEDCVETEYTPGSDEGGTSHPNANFFRPGAKDLPSEADLNHLLLADNAVVVIYSADIDEAEIDGLSSWWRADVNGRTPVVIPDETPGAPRIVARIASIEMRCDEVDFARLTEFANRTDVAPSLRDHG